MEAYEKAMQILADAFSLATRNRNRVAQIIIMHAESFLTRELNESLGR